ncbi:serine/threonine protein kinase [Streptomyces diastatochromogenes]|uniref:serine/threonine protein kinase n=1 Tax=Streptomyces diastatochromogenes TaxID=42236 RepID=UPI00368BBF66
MTSCLRPGCAGHIMGTGFCDTCGHRHLEPRTEPRSERQSEPRTEPAPPPTGPGAEESPGPQPTHAVAGVGELDQHGLVRLPDVPDPEGGLVEDPRTPTGGRRCGANGCTMTIGIGIGLRYGGQPARATGRCPRCGTPYSFLPQPDKGDLVAGHYRSLGCLARGGLGRIHPEHWARGPLPWQSKQVKGAWTTWGTTVGAGGSRDLVLRVLRTEYQEASEVVRMHPPQCTLEHQASFLRNLDPWKEARGRYEHSARLIPGATTDDAWEVSGDLVALLHATPRAQDLIRHRAFAETQRAWSTKEAGLSVSAHAQPTAGDSTPDWRRSLARTLLDPKAVHCFDASDAMPPPVRDAFARATIDLLADPRRLDDLLKNLDGLGGAENLSRVTSVYDRT